MQPGDGHSDNRKTHLKPSARNTPAPSDPPTARAAEALKLERDLIDPVNQAYGLTAAEIALMWATAPPRMPIPKPQDTATPKI